MRTLPPEPNPGEKISASLIRELIRAIRERTPIAGHGMSVSIGPNGSVLSSKTGGGVSASVNNGRFAIKSITKSSSSDEGGEGDDEESERKYIHFANTYYRIAGRTFELPEELREVELKNGAFVALRLKVGNFGNSIETEIVNFDTLSEMQNVERNDSYFVCPLYKISESGTVECDFRIGPDATTWEVPS